MLRLAVFHPESMTLEVVADDNTGGVGQIIAEAEARRNNGRHMCRGWPQKEARETPQWERRRNRNVTTGYDQGRSGVHWREPL